MVSYTYLGYGTTNSDGVAHLDHDADGEPIDHSYTGVGAGEIDVLASLDNPIIEGSIVSETYTVHDDLFYCKGTSGNVNQYWSAESGLTSTPDTEGNLLENSASSGKAYIADIPASASVLDFNTPLCIEFKCISTTGARIFLNSSSGGSNIDRSIGSYITGNNKVKMIIRANTYDLIVDDETKLSNQSHTLVNPVGIKLVINANCSLKYSDFEVYPI